MSMVYGLVKQHKGFVHLYSELGQGTTVKVYFPAVHDPRVPEHAATADDILPGGSEAILVVEDDPTMLAAAARLLTNVGYRVLTAANGAEGLERYRVHRSEVDLVLTDMVMPKLGGFELYEAIRRHSRDVKVLFTSGFPAPNFRKSVGGDDGVAFVTKPWTANELLGCVRTLLRP
jgi:CheY-like chemotaxis protein